jgi:site-specific recombinase XerD
MLINIKESKVRKDRYTLLSRTFFEIIKEYLRKYRSQKWLFEGARKDRYLSAGTADKIFIIDCKKARINKKVYFHTLRYSLATHLLEGGEWI